MPSVGMRRSTRGFVPKYGDVGRVLRSGRRLPPESTQVKNYRRKGDQNSHPVDNSGKIVGVLPNSQSNSEQDTKVTKKSIGRRRVTSAQDVEVTNKSNRRRKVNSERDIEVTDMDTEVDMLSIRDCKRKEFPQPGADLMYGTSYVRKKLRRTDVKLSLGVDSVDCQGRYGSEFGILGPEKTSIGGPGGALDVIVESSPGSSLRFACFLVSVLKFMRSSRVALPGLTALIFCEPIFEVFSRHGVHFMPALSPRTSVVNDIISPGFCRIFGDQPFMPLVWMDFPAAPLFFRNLHTLVFLPSLCRSHVLPCFSISLLHGTHGVVEERKTVSCLPSKSTLPQTSRTGSGNSSVKEIHASFDVDGFGMAGREISTRSAVSRNIQKKRSPLRSKRVNNSSSRGFHGIQNNNINSGKRILASVGLDVFKIMDGGYCASSTLRSNVNVAYKAKRGLCYNYEAVKPTVVGPGDGIGLLSCNVNVLVIDSDRCFREEGATVLLECSTSKIWHVAVKAQGLTKYIHRVHDVMRPSTTNRFTHAMIWTSEDGWKLEFCNRKDWFVFKELYKECWERNLDVDSTMAIPVPGVREVPNYDDDNHALFSRPDSYISVHDNEVARALKKKRIYEIDSDDEEWLEKLNSGQSDGNIATAEHLSAEKFEKVIDILEKAAYHSHGDVSDENKLTTLCSELGEEKIITAVYQYWLKKRKQKRAAFLKVFECQPSLKALVEEEDFLCKKRSVKKQVSQNGRDKLQFYVEAMSEEPEEQDKKKAEEVKFRAEESFKSAVSKRKRAQALMDNADLAAYLASMALNIAETIQITESASASALLL